MKKFIFGLLLLVVIGGGAFYVYRTHEAVKHVMSHEAMVDDLLKKEGLENDKSLVLAIIYEETKGGSTDVMQSSESVTGKQNDIDTQNLSLTIGVNHLTEMLNYAKAEGTDVWTGVQAYNFGKAYVDYIAKNGGKTSVKLAETYSREVVAPSLGNKNGETYRYLTWESVFYNGGKLYKNGGNFFYVDEVKTKMQLLKWFN